jgi:uncharacterized protein with von Willebrand factor type A (vWA) domain
MFATLFYNLKEAGIPVSPTSFITLHRAMQHGLVNSLSDLYVAARSLLVKSEKYFDKYDQVFTFLFSGGALPDSDQEELDFMAHALLDEWLRDPARTARALGEELERLETMSVDELLDYFKKRMAEQKGRHVGGSKWIGTGGTSPVGHSGFHPGGMRIDGISVHKSAVQVARERRYRDYSADLPLSSSSVGEALKKLRNMIPQGPRDHLNVEASIYQTMRNAGEIEIVFDRRSVDRLNVVLAIDNGGWSMEPHVNLVRVLFTYAQSHFRQLRTYYFHNTIYDVVWEDPARYKKPCAIDELARLDPDTRLIVVGDASMAPYELMVPDGSIYAFRKSGRPSIERLKFLTSTFRHAVWLNPVAEKDWKYTRTIESIRSIFPMFELSLAGLDGAVRHLME